MALRAVLLPPHTVHCCQVLLLSSLYRCASTAQSGYFPSFPTQEEVLGRCLEDAPGSPVCVLRWDGLGGGSAALWAALKYRMF